LVLIVDVSLRLVLSTRDTTDRRGRGTGGKPSKEVTAAFLDKTAGRKDKE
jgi:hypothetical protein